MKRVIVVPGLGGIKDIMSTALYTMNIIIPYTIQQVQAPQEIQPAEGSRKNLTYNPISLRNIATI